MANGEELAARLNIGEVTGWRLHWLTRKLCNLQDEMQKADFGMDPASLRNGVHAEFAAKLKSIAIDYANQRWEVRTMLDNSFENERALFNHLSQNVTYQEELGKATSFLTAKAEQILGAEAQRIKSSLIESTKLFI
jgi:hypothetical protein